MTPLVEVTGGPSVAEDARRWPAASAASLSGRRGAVGVDLGDVARLEPGVGERQPHAGDGADAAGGGRGDVVGVGGGGAAEELGRGSWRPALTARSHSSSSRIAAALGDHEAVAVRGEGRDTPSFDSAVMLVKPARPVGVSDDSVPPATMASQRPQAMRSAARVMRVGAGGAGGDRGLARALPAVPHRHRRRRRRWASSSARGTARPGGRPSRRGRGSAPRASRCRRCRWRRTRHGGRVVRDGAVGDRRPARAPAVAAARANWAKRSARRASFGLSKYGAGIEVLDLAHRRRRAPAHSPSQNASMPVPALATTPSRGDGDAPAVTRRAVLCGHGFLLRRFIRACP